MSTTTRTVQPNKSIPIYKFDTQGNLVHTYRTMIDAVKGERVTHAILCELLSSGQHLRGFSFSKEKEFAGDIIEDDHSARAPWEGANGMFDLGGWKTVCFLLALLFSIGCTNTDYLAQDASLHEIFFFKDNSTGLCFAEHNVAYRYGLVCVPCDSLKKIGIK